ncbi:MAG: 30S ribosomal protein S8 [Methanomicrobia archaeon]|jgi:small subunit ribosomal protein S8|nr:30S ribosomal protein S8 [Methanomicrobia archaeon]
MLNDPLADALSNITNHEEARKTEVIIPASRIIGNILKIMQKYNFIGAFEFIDDGKSGNFKVELIGNINKCGVIKPRSPVKKDGFEKWEKRFLPAKNFGILLISTPKGITSHKEADANETGGRLLAYVY